MDEKRFINTHYFECEKKQLGVGEKVERLGKKKKKKQRTFFDYHRIFLKNYQLSSINKETDMKR